MQLKGEELKLKIDDEMKKLFDRLDEYVNECKKSIDANQIDSKEKLVLDEELRKGQSDLDSWFKDLDKFVTLLFILFVF